MEMQKSFRMQQWGHPGIGEHSYATEEHYFLEDLIELLWFSSEKLQL